MKALKSKSKEMEKEYFSKLSTEEKGRVQQSPCSYGDFNGNICPRCSTDKVHEQKLVKGCRMNGDGYGTYTKLCNNCGMFGTWDYDDHD